MEPYDHLGKVVIFPNDETGGIRLFSPAPECELSLSEMIEKVVPENTPHQILNQSDVPTDHTFFNAWTYEEN